MSTILDQKKMEQAIRWVDEALKEGKNIDKLLQEAGMRFNLGPQEVEFLLRFFKEEKKEK